MEEFALDSRVYGSHTITLGAIVTSPHSISVPLSRDIKTWSREQEHITSIKTRHKSIITFACQSPDRDLYVTCEWSGVVAVHDNTWTLKYTFPAPNPPCAAVTFLSPSKLAVLSRGNNEFNPGCVLVVELGEERVEGRSEEVWDSVWQISCFQQRLYVWKWVEPTFSLLRYNARVLLENKFELLTEKCAAVGHAINEKYIVLALKNRDLLLLDTATMNKVPSDHLKCVSHSVIWAIEFASQEHVILQKSKDNFVILNVENGDTVRTFAGPESFCCFMEIAGNVLWIGTVDGVFSIEFPDDSVITETEPNQGVIDVTMTSFLFHEISCCGLCISHSRVISGDLAGNILIWDTSQDTSSPVEKVRIEDSVRCLAAVRNSGGEDDLVVFIGTLSGCLLQWTPGCEPQPVVFHEDTITCIRTTDDRLCFGLVTGDIELYDVTQTPETVILSHLHSVKIHHPATDSLDPRFGSLMIKAEIWSLVFSPSRTQVATCSEDQTVRITDLESQTTVTEFRDHTLAVTCLAWIHHNGLSLIISCSDDNTVVIRETETQVRLSVLQLPPDVIGFCTLTYLGVIITQSSQRDDCVIPVMTSQRDDSGTADYNIILTASRARELYSQCSVLIACGSENGYLIVRDMVSGRVVFNERVHQGSIEGLVSDEMGRMVTCASDCCVQVHDIASILV